MNEINTNLTFAYQILMFLPHLNVHKEIWPELEDCFIDILVLGELGLSEDPQSVSVLY